jgi:hypothetical protein
MYKAVTPSFRRVPGSDEIPDEEIRGCDEQPWTSSEDVLRSKIAEFVEKHPEIWQSDSPKFKSGNRLRLVAWNTLANSLQIDVQEVIKFGMAEQKYSIVLMTQT